MKQKSRVTQEVIIKNKSYKILGNESGMAIIMVMTAVSLLTLMLADFTFETKLNKIKIYHQQDRTQARLIAEAGLNLAIAKIRIYQEARNLVEKDENIKSMIKPSLLESVVTQPFAYPIPQTKSMSLIEKNAISDFAKEIILDGEMILSVSAVKGFLNPNNLRIVKKKEETEEEKEKRESEEANDSEKKSADQIIEEKLIETLKNAITKEMESNEEFAAIYSNINPELLIKELKYYVSNSDDFEDTERADIEGRYFAKNILPKHAPLTSIEELYMLEGWDSAIVDLIKDDLTVHESSVIPVNEINKKQLLLLFPDMTPDQTENFFKSRDGSEAEKIQAEPFKDVEDFKTLIVKKLAVIGEAAYDERIKEFEAAGLKLGTAGKLFRVSSMGKYNQSIYNISALVDIPIKPDPPKKKKTSTDKINESTKEDEKFDKVTEDANQDLNNNPDKKDPKEEEKTPIQFLKPRIVNIVID